MNESELYRELGILTDDKDKWEETIPYIASLLTCEEDHMPIFERLLYDTDDKVRMEAPEIFRVLGKRKPEFVRPYVEQLQHVAETDNNHVVRIHSLGAIKATESK